MSELGPRRDELAAAGEPRRPSLRVAWLASAAAIAAMLAVSAWTWSALPAGGRVPVHFGLDGQPDRFGGRGEALLTVPLAALLVAGLLALVPRLEPRALHFASSRKAYVATGVALMALLAGVHGLLVSSALGHAVDALERARLDAHAPARRLLPRLETRPGQAGRRALGGARGVRAGCGRPGRWIGGAAAVMLSG